MDAIDELEAFCDELEEGGAERVVVRWIDENRPVHDDEGVTIRQVTEATVKSAIDGEMVSRTFEGLTRPKLKAALEARDFDVLFRSDNLTRR